MPGPSSSWSIEQKNFYFLEMNTRLQVEHPVTELTTGLDLVHLQIRIAAGERLPFKQEDVHLRGHAIECRIYAEDPDNNFFPSPGKITLLLAPSGPGIRRDSGMYEGWTVPIDYDPLLAKLIGYGTDREQATARLVRALNEYFVGGIKTNISLFRRILSDPEFIAGRLDTGYLDRLLAQPDETAPAERERRQWRRLPPECSLCSTRPPQCRATRLRERSRRDVDFELETHGETRRNQLGAPHHHDLRHQCRRHQLPARTESGRRALGEPSGWARGGDRRSPDAPRCAVDHHWRQSVRDQAGAHGDGHAPVGGQPALCRATARSAIPAQSRDARTTGKVRANCSRPCRARSCGFW